jgi:GNAT superfamily N-acetyltransferase
VTIRDADPADAAQVAELLGELGYPVDEAEARRRLERGTERVLVAADGDRLLGLGAVATSSNITTERPLARLTALVVRPDARRTGVGRRLLDEAIALARTGGCAGLELTSSLRPEREASHRFYAAYGFQRSSYRFWLPLTEPP